jgi:hypothetical protein
MALETFFFAYDGRHACTVTDLDSGPLAYRKKAAIAKAVYRTGLPAHALQADGPSTITQFITASVHERTHDGTGWIQRESIFMPLYGTDTEAAKIVRSELTWLWMDPLESGFYTYSPHQTAEVGVRSDPAGIPVAQGDRA